MMKFAVCLLGVVFSLTALSQQNSPVPVKPQPGKPFSIGVGVVGDSHYVYGSALASVLSRTWRQPVVAEVTGGAIENARLLKSGEVDAALITTGVLADAANGRGQFSADGAIPLRALMVLYPNRMHVAVLEGSGIKSINDLKGRRVSIGSELGMASIVSSRILEAAGLKDADYRRFQLNTLDSVKALKDGAIDAFFYASGEPIVELSQVGALLGSKLKLLPTQQYVEPMTKKYGGVYFKDALQLHLNPRKDSSVGVVSVWTILVASASMSNQAAYNLVKTMSARQPDLIPLSPNAHMVVRENQSNAISPVPFHPGAVKFYAESGVNLK